MQKANIHILTLLLILMSVPLAGCRKGDDSVKAAAEILNSDSIPGDVKSVVKAIAENDSDEFARLVSYPLARPYPLHDITNESEMRAYYSTLIDDSMRRMLTHSHVRDWGSDGWRGWTVGNGDYVWIDSLVYDVNYVSPKEKREQKRLMDKEIASLPRRLRHGGWKPMTCLKGVHHTRVARIDSRHVQKGDSTQYRIAVFDSIVPQHIEPSMVMDGYLTSEGTSETEYYIFTDGKGTTAIYETNIADSPNSYLIITRPNAPAEEMEMEKAYWEDLINPKMQPHEAVHKAIPGLAPPPSRPQQQTPAGEQSETEPEGTSVTTDSLPRN